MLRAFILKEMFCKGNVFLRSFLELTFRFFLEIVQTLCDFYFIFSTGFEIYALTVKHVARINLDASYEPCDPMLLIL